MSADLFGASSGSGGIPNGGGTFDAAGVPFTLNPTQQQFNNMFGGSLNFSQSSSTPVNMTPPAFAALQSPLATSLAGMFGGGPIYSGVSSAFNSPSTSFNPQIGSNPTAGTGIFSAGMSPQESQLLQTIMGPGGGSPSPTNQAAASFLQTALGPNYAQSVVNSPSTAAAISAATNPLISAFQNVTMPNLQGTFAANGQVLNGAAQTGPGATASGSGSSAFDKAAAIAGTGLDQSIASTAAPIAQNAMLAGMQQQGQAATQAPALTSSDLNDLVTSLQAEALPRLIQQYGMDEGLQQFNNQVNVMLQALGLGTSASRPVIAQESQSSSEGNSTKGVLGDFASMF